MGFFAEFSAWLMQILRDYVSNNTAQIAQALEPAIVTLGVLYIVVWGYLQLMGRIEEPFVTGIKRLILLAVILGLSLSLWYYNEVIVDTFFVAPADLAARVIGAYDSVGIVDRIIFAGNEVANAMNAKAGILRGNFSFYLAAFAVQAIVLFTALYTMFLLMLSRVALSVLLALGPLFIALLFFETTKKFFESWVAQLANYAFITILTSLVAALMLTVVTRAAEQAIAAGGGIEMAHAARLCLAAGFTLLVMRQVMPMAAGLAGGLALSTFGLVSAAMAWGLGRMSRHSGQFGRGFLDAHTAHMDPLSRKAGYYTRRGVSKAARTLWHTARRPNSIRAA